MQKANKKFPKNNFFAERKQKKRTKRIYLLHNSLTFNTIMFTTNPFKWTTKSTQSKANKAKTTRVGKKRQRRKLPESYKVSLPQGSIKYVFGRAGKNVKRIQRKLCLKTLGVTEIRIKASKNKDLTESFWCVAVHDGTASPSWKDELSLLLHQEIATFVKKSLEKETKRKEQKATKKQYSHPSVQTSGKCGSNKNMGTRVSMSDFVGAAQSLNIRPKKTKAVVEKETFDLKKSTNSFPSLLSSSSSSLGESKESHEQYQKETSSFNVEAATFVPSAMEAPNAIVAKNVNDVSVKEMQFTNFLYVPVPVYIKVASTSMYNNPVY